MMRESLVGIRTVREVHSGLDQARRQKAIKTTSASRRVPVVVEPHVDDRTIAIALEKERRRFQRQWEVLNKFQKKMGGIRQKLVNVKEKNRRIMELRLTLSKQYWRDTSPLSLAQENKKLKEPKRNVVKLSY